MAEDHHRVKPRLELRVTWGAEMGGVKRYLFCMLLSILRQYVYSFIKMPHFHTGITGQPRTHPNPEAESGPWDTETQSQAPDGSNKWPLSIGNIADLNQEPFVTNNGAPSVRGADLGGRTPQPSTFMWVGMGETHSGKLVGFFAFDSILNQIEVIHLLWSSVLLQMITKYFWAPINGESGSSGMKFSRVFLILL